MTSVAPSPSPRAPSAPCVGLVALAALSGCATTFAQGQAGAVVGTSGALGGAVEGSYGRGASGFGLEATVRAKFTTRVLSGALGGGLFVAGGGDTCPVFWGHLGAHALQLDVLDETPYLSAFSPYLTGGVGICLDGYRSPDRAIPLTGVTTSTRERQVLTLGLAAEYDVRFARSGEAFFGLMVGYGYLSQDEARLPF